MSLFRGFGALLTGQLGRAVREFTGEADRRREQRQRERRREHDRAVPPPEPPIQPPESVSGPPFGPTHYHEDTDTWTGSNAPSQHQWSEITRLAYDQIDDGATFNKDLELNSQALFSTGNKAEDLRAIIQAIESEAMAPRRMLQWLRETAQSADEYALHQNSNRGRRRYRYNSFSGEWVFRYPNLPDELGWYHWGF
jgi:hypothetical protein